MIISISKVNGATHLIPNTLRNPTSATIQFYTFVGDPMDGDGSVNEAGVLTIDKSVVASVDVGIRGFLHVTEREPRHSWVYSYNWEVTD